MSKNKSYSEKEFQMIRELSPSLSKLIDNAETSGDYLFPPKILEIIALDCFMDNKTGAAVDSLRRCVKANKNNHPYRMTKEYDDLINL